MRNRFARHIVASAGLKATYTLLSFSIAVLLARLLQPDGYGIYTSAFAVLSIVFVPAQFGLPELVVRETARHLETREWGPIHGVWRWSVTVAALLSIALGVAVILVGGFGWLGMDSGGTYARTLAWGGLLVPLLALGALRGAALRGLGRIVLGLLPEQLILPGMFLALLALAAAGVTGVDVGPDTAMALRGVAALAAFVAGAILLWHIAPRQVFAAEPVRRGRRWLGSTIPLALTSGIHLTNQYADILILSAFASASEVGVYRVAVQVALVAAFGLQAVNMVVAPRFARLFATQRVADLQRLVTLSSRTILAFSLAIVVAIVLAGRWGLSFAFGPEFAPAFTPLLILLGGQLVNCAVGSVGVLLNMTGFEQDTARAVTAAAVTNVVLNLVFVPMLGATGAGIATAFSTSLLNVILWRAVRRRLGIDASALGRMARHPVRRPE